MLGTETEVYFDFGLQALFTDDVCVRSGEVKRNAVIDFVARASRCLQLPRVSNAVCGDDSEVTGAA